MATEKHIVRFFPIATYANITHYTFMSKEKLEYIYDEEEFNQEYDSVEYYSGPVPMGKEKDYLQRMNSSVQEFKRDLQKNADIEAENKKKVDTSGQLFGISSQNINQRVSLDEKFPGEMLYQIKADNMSPYILPDTYVMLRFCEVHASGEICVFRYKGKTYCNQIKHENGKLIAISLNKKYKAVFLNPDEYFFIAVVTSIHRTIKRKKLTAPSKNIQSEARR
jgi:hypothetical protein